MSQLGSRSRIGHRQAWGSFRAPDGWYSYNGDLAARRYQDSFGNAQAGWTGSAFSGLWAQDQTGWGHNTKEGDGDAGLVYMHQRWYAPETGTFRSSSPLSPWEESDFAFCENNPVSLHDPTGLWGEPVHRGDTYVWCLRSGGDPALCQRIAGHDAGFDKGWTRPWIPGFGSNKHFPQALDTVHKKAVDAICRCDERAFGRALHQVQDYFAHVLPDYPGSSGPVVRNHAIPTLRGMRPDDPTRHPGLHGQTEAWSISLLSQYVRNCARNLGNWGAGFVFEPQR